MNNKLISVNDIKLINSICLFMDEPFQILDINRIESALSNQYQPYPNLELAFASTYKSLVINHGFMNGNKRTAVIVRLQLIRQIIVIQAFMPIRVIPQGDRMFVNFNILCCIWTGSVKC